MPEYFNRSTLKTPVMVSITSLIVLVLCMMWIAWRTQEKTEVVEAQTKYVAAEIPKIKATEAEHNRQYMGAHYVTHRRLEGIQKTEEHIIRQQDQNTHALSELEYKVRRK